MRLVSRFALTAFLLAVAIVFGGGGTPAPLPELLAQLAALLALCVWPFLPRPAVSQPVDRLIWIGTGLFAALPLIQLIPLPPTIWHTFPGRETEIAALNLIGAGDSWRPISLAPYQTIASALSLIPPVTILFFVSRLAAQERTGLLAWVAGLALLSGLVGVVQVASGGANWPRFYRFPNIGFATGFQDNRNGTADIFLIGILATCALAAARKQFLASPVAKAVVSSFVAFLCLSVVLTGSRAGTALLIACPIFSLLIFRPNLRMPRSRVIAAFGVAAALAIGGFWLRDNAALDRTWVRFTNTIDTRPRIWEDTHAAIAQYWPLGAGVGTFTTVFPAAERLEGVHATVTNRAHQDYLEFALETGVAGMIVLIGGLLALAYRVTTIVRRARQRDILLQCLFAVGAITILALHSIVDYPIRSMSLATIASLSLALLSRQSESATNSRREPTKRIREVSE